MVRFGPDLGHSSLNVRKITGRSDMHPEPVVQCNFMFVLNEKGPSFALVSKSFGITLSKLCKTH